MDLREPRGRPVDEESVQFQTTFQNMSDQPTLSVGSTFAPSAMAPAAAVASLKLGERRSGNNDVPSLQRELDSIRKYRDVLHETMKGLVAQAQGKLAADAAPALVSSLAHVAELLSAFSEPAIEPPPPQAAAPAADAEAALQEAQREREAREAAEAELATLQRSADLMNEQLVATELQRDSVTLQLAEQRRLRPLFESQIADLEVEASSLDAVLTRLSVQKERERCAAVEALTRAEDAHGQALAGAAAAAVAADADAKALADSINECAEARDAAARAEAARVEAESSAMALMAELDRARADARQAHAESDRWRAGIESAALEIDALKRRVRELEGGSPLPPAPAPAQPQVFGATPQKSRFTQYVESRDARSGRQRAASAEQQPQSSSPAPTGALRPARERGGSLLGAPSTSSTIEASRRRPPG